MNLVELKAFLIENQDNFTLPKSNYAFLQKIVLFNKNGFDMPVCKAANPMQYKMMMRLVKQYIK